MQTGQFDFILRNVRIVDGSGAPWYLADVAIHEGRIAAIGALSTAAAVQVIEGEGRYLVPGFVDAHSHVDLQLLAQPDFPASSYQGVTSHVIGQDGISYAPSSVENQKHLRQYFAGVNGDPQLSEQWTSVDEYLRCFDRKSVCNVAYLLPQGTIRLEVMGDENRRPNAQEMQRMQALVEQGMREGAVGISTGLDYVPCIYADTDELVEMCRPVARHGGVYVAHMRAYPEGIQRSVQETEEIGRRAGLAVHISHYNGRAELLSGLVNDARNAGSDMTFDTYPYLAGCTILSMVGLPRWAEEGGTEATLARLADPDVRERLREWHHNERVYSVDSLQLAYVEQEEDRELEGLRVPEAARKRGVEVMDFICDLLIRSRMRVACIAHHSNRTEEDVIALMQHPAHMGGSDGIYTGGKPHPRGFGTFARYLEYVRDRQVMSLEEMVRHLSYHPSRRFGLRERGLIAVGWHADLALFDLSNIRSVATYEAGAQLAQGMDWVFVNGQPVLADGKPTGLRPGVGIRGPACANP